MRLGRDEQSRVSGIVAVRLEERRSARTHRAVGIELDAADPEGAPVQGAPRPASERPRHRGGVVADHRVDARVEFARAAEFLVYVEDTLSFARVVHSGESPALRLGDRVHDLALQFFARRPRHRALHDALRVVDEHAARAPVRVVFDAAAGGILRRGCDAGRVHRHPVREVRVAVHALEKHRVVRDGGGELHVRRESRVGPAVLVPAASGDPHTWRDGPRLCRDARDDLVVARRAGEIHDRERGAEARNVAVRIDHAGDDGAPAEVEHLRLRSPERERAARVTGERDAAAAHRERLHHGTRLVHRIDAGVGDDEIGGRLLRGERRSCEREGEAKEAFHDLSGREVVGIKVAVVSRG